jgi:predicted ATPase/transcriptional regulator with XRE-family HTH domain
MRSVAEGPVPVGPGMETRDPPRLDELVRRHRTAAALSQEELAERAGLSVRAISDLERGVHRTPRLETVRLVADVFRLGEVDRAELLAAARPHVMALGPRQGARSQAPGSLPVPLTRLIGRETEAAAVTQLLAQDDVRLVTLTGPGGVGKTRLALQAAVDQVETFPDGVWFVDLAPIADPTLVPAAMAQVLGVRAEGSLPLVQVLTTFVRTKVVLLVLDNFEHVLDAGPMVSGFLRDAPGLKVLTTSRAPLRLRGEREIPIAPLEVPDPRRHESVERLSQYGAVRLFIACAQDSRPDFTVTNETASAVAEICARLDGLPLALELAAARVKLLSPPALLARLDRRLPLLTGGARDAPARQQALRNTIAWSYDLLSPDEQALFRSLTVFAGGIALDAAEDVIDLSVEGDVLTGLAALVDESLLRETESTVGEPRFRMLETVREFGFDALTGTGEAIEIRSRHAAWFLRLAEEAEQALRGPDQITWLNRLDAERDNLRAAFSWALERNDTDTALRLANALGSFWMVRGTVSEGRTWLERALERAESAPGPLRARALLELAWMAAVQSDLDAAERAATKAAAEARAAEVPIIEARAAYLLAHIAAIRGDLDRAATLVEKADRQYGPLGPDTLSPGDSTMRARIEHRRGNGDRARILFAEALAYLRTEAGDLHWIADVLDSLGDLACDQGDVVGAIANYGEALAAWQALGDLWGIADALTGFADVAVRVGQPGRAAQLLGAADALYEQVGIAVPPHDRITYPKTVDAIRTQLGPDAFAAAHSAGRALTMEEAVAEATALADEVTASHA